MRDSGLTQSLALAAQMGFAIACPMLAFIGGGAWLDDKLGSSHWLLLLGALLGILAAGGFLYTIFRGQPTGTRVKRPDGAPYKVESDETSAPDAPGTQSADKRERNGR